MLPRLLIRISLARQPWKVPKINRRMKVSSMTRSAAPPSPLRLPAGKMVLLKDTWHQICHNWKEWCSCCVTQIKTLKFIKTFPNELLTGMLWQPSFAVADVVRWMCLLVGHRLVTFPYSNTSGSVLGKNKENYTLLDICWTLQSIHIDCKITFTCVSVSDMKNTMLSTVKDTHHAASLKWWNRNIYLATHRCDMEASACRGATQ